jgi:hypothetical protein
MDIDDLEPSTNTVRRLGQAGLFIATALIVGVGFAFLADSNGGTSEVRMPAVTEVPYTAHLAVAPRADRLPKSQQAAPVTALEPGEDDALARVVERALAETHIAKAPTIAPTHDFGPVASVPPPIPVARPEPPAPAIAQLDEPADVLVPMEPIPQHEYVAAEEFDGRHPARRKGRAADTLGLPFGIVAATADQVGRTVVSLGNAVASIGRPARRY